MGHVGLTPQSATLGDGYKARGRTAVEARRILDEARALERAGCFAVVLEAIPAAVAAHISDVLKIPTIGIGAGPSCDGQVLVWHDLLGLTPGHVPRFVKQYADLKATIATALEAYVADVRSGSFPAAEHTYGMPDGGARAVRVSVDGGLSDRRLHEAFPGTVTSGVIGGYGDNGESFASKVFHTE